MDYWEQSIDTLAFGSRELKVLQSLKIKCLRELKELNLKKVLMLKGCGTFTYSRLQRIQKKLLDKEKSYNTSKTKNSELTFEEITWDLSVRTQHILESLGVNTINALLGLTDKIILNCRGAGRTVLSEITRVQKKIQWDSHCSELQNIDNDKVLLTDVLRTISVRTRRALNIFEVNSFEDLLNITENDIVRTRTLGRGTWNEIVKLQKKYCHLGTRQQVNWLKTPVNKDNIKKLPLFSSLRLAISDIDLHSSYMPYLKLEIISLPKWTEQRIKKLAIGSIGELLLVPGNDFLNIQGLGKKKLDEIQKIVYDFLLSNSDYKQYYTQNATIERLNSFPFFNGITQPNVDLNEIDQSYYSNQSLNSLSLPVRVLNAFHKSGINTIGELLTTTPANLTKQSNFGVKSLNTTRQIISKFILDGSEKMDLSNSASLSEIFIKYATTLLPERSYKVIEMKLGLLDGQPKTFREIAQALHLSHERIRQIQKKVKAKLKLSTNLMLLKDLRLIIEKIIKRSGGRIHFKELANEIDKNFNWNVPSNINLISFLNDLFKICEVKNNVLLLPDFPCDYCNHPMEIILREVSDKSAIEYSKLSEKIAGCCKKFNCDFFKENKLNFSWEFFENYISIKPSLAENYVCCYGTVCTKVFEQIQYGSKQDIIEYILKESSEPLHFTRIATIYKIYCPGEKITEHSVHANLNYLDKAILWDRGTFIHYDHVRFDSEFTTDISNWLSSKLDNGLNFISIAGAYNHFKKRCNELKIISESALYSYLRLEKPKSLFLNRYPFVTKSNQRFYLQEFLEQYVIENDGEVEIKKLKKLWKKHCFRNSLLTMFKNSSNLLFTDNNKIIHIDNLNINTNDFHEICKYSKNLLANSNSISVQKIYRDKIVSCRLLGITGPRLLFSCFQSFGKDYIATGRYPLLKGLDKKSFKELNIRSELEEHVKENGLCSREQLIERFVEQAGYSEYRINMMPYYSDNILVYSSGCYIHSKALGWNKKQYGQLSQLLEDSYFEKINMGWHYAKLKDIYDYKYDKLPDIDGDFPWTLRLLRSLAERIEKFKFLGNAKDAYIKINATGKIKSLDDLIYDLLYQEYDGAANKEELEKRLVNEGILLKRLTPNMVSNSEKLIINGNNVIAKDLIRNV